MVNVLSKMPNYGLDRNILEIYKSYKTVSRWRNQTECRGWTIFRGFNLKDSFYAYDWERDINVIVVKEYNHISHFKLGQLK